MELLNLPSLIRMNRSVRGTLQVDELERWWHDAPRPERDALTFSLFFCAKEAGIKGWMLDDALRSAGLSGEDDGVLQAVAATRGAAEAAVFYSWIPGASDESQQRAFRFGYHVFGLAEGEVFRAETPETCNHWWHRDLLDPRVVADLLADPRYYLTSRATDRRLR